MGKNAQVVAVALMFAPMEYFVLLAKKRSWQTRGYVWNVGLAP